MDFQEATKSIHGDALISDLREVFRETDCRLIPLIFASPNGRDVLGAVASNKKHAEPEGAGCFFAGAERQLLNLNKAVCTFPSVSVSLNIRTQFFGAVSGAVRPGGPRSSSSRSCPGWSH